MKTKNALALVILFVMAASQRGFPNLISNGSFEQSVAPGSVGWTTILGGNKADIVAWEVTGHSIDLKGSHWRASDGAKSIDLCGTYAGGVKQTFATEKGRTYQVTFDLAGNPDQSPAVKGLAVLVAGKTMVFTFDTTGKTRQSMGWEQQTFTFTAADTSTTIEFRSVTSGGYGPVIDNVSVVAEGIAPTVTTQPQNLTCAPGQSASFTVVASGTAPLTYQWRQNGVNIAGANSATYTISAATASTAGDYSVVVSNNAGSVTSQTAALTVISPIAPTILAQPASSTNVVGESVNFVVSATGTQPIRYQWLFNGKNIGGATNAAFALASVKLTDAGSYSVIVVNDFGSTLSQQATLVVLPQIPPIITAQPTSFVAAKGERAVFQVSAIGTPTPTFQWFRQDQSIAGATSSSFSIASVQSADAGSYSVVISNPAGIVRSTNAILTLRPQLRGMKLSVLHGFQYSIDGESGKAYTLEASDDLQGWTSLMDVKNTNVVSVFLEPTATNRTYRFYRAKVK